LPRLWLHSGKRTQSTKSSICPCYRIPLGSQSSGGFLQLSSLVGASWSTRYVWDLRKLHGIYHPPAMFTSRPPYPKCTMWCYHHTCPDESVKSNHGVPQGKVTAAQCAHLNHANWPADVSGPINAPCVQLRSLRLLHFFILLRLKFWVARKLNQNCTWTLCLGIILAGAWKHFFFASIHFILCCLQVLDVLCACQ